MSTENLKALTPMAATGPSDFHGDCGRGAERHGSRGQETGAGRQGGRGQETGAGRHGGNSVIT